MAGQWLLPCFCFILLVTSAHSLCDLCVKEGMECQSNAFQCFGDCCERGVMFCDSRQTRCRNCDVLNPSCGTDSMPVECLGYCLSHNSSLQSLNSSLHGDGIFVSRAVVIGVAVAVSAIVLILATCLIATCCHFTKKVRRLRQKYGPETEGLMQDGSTDHSRNLDRDLSCVRTLERQHHPSADTIGYSDLADLCHLKEDADAVSGLSINAPEQQTTGQQTSGQHPSRTGSPRHPVTEESQAPPAPVPAGGPAVALHRPQLEPLVAEQQPRCGGSSESGESGEIGPPLARVDHTTGMGAQADRGYSAMPASEPLTTGRRDNPSLWGMPPTTPHPDPASLTLALTYSWH